MAKNKEKLEWQLETRKVADLIPADYNPRKLSDKAQSDLQASVSKFGQVEPLVVNANGTVIGGHSRIKVYADLGIEETPVMVPNRKLTKEEERELNLRLNRNTGEWDWEKLKEFFDVGEMLEAGFGSAEISTAFDKMKEVHEDDFDADAEAAKITKPVSQLGEVWALGDHRIIVGDSTKSETYLALLGDLKADMCFTDPPYNVNYNHQKKYGKIHKARKSAFVGGDAVIGDHQSDADFAKFLEDTFRNIYMFTVPSAGIYICHAMGTRSAFFDAFIGAGFHYSQTIIWLKERIILSLGQDFHRIYEPIMYGWKKGTKRWSNKSAGVEKELWDMDRMTFEERLDVWYLNRDKSKDYIHPTQKPVRLPERAIKKSSPTGGVVLEPFGGSGSTLIACEQLGRKCYAVELDPRYCDGIIKRWETFTGKKAERIKTS